MVDLCNFENRLDQWLFRFHREIEQVFNELKRNELEQNRKELNLNLRLSKGYLIEKRSLQLVLVMV
jgi:hypothetical protein